MPYRASRPAVWRDRQMIVVERGARAPARCVRCGVDAPALRLLTDPPLSLCDAHVSARREALEDWALFAALAVGLGLAGFALALGALVVFASGLLSVAVIGLASSARLVRTRRRGRLLWLKGVHTSLLESLPELGGR